MIFADERANGIPPPGCTLPPQKYRFYIEKKVFVTEKCSKPTIA
jgi:hypothetical protein